MSASHSIAQEFYKLRQYWKEIDTDENWRLAIWAVRYEDVVIVDKFMEIERSALGSFDDIFFRFETEYRGDPEQFEKELFEEWKSWFEEKPDPSLDILQSLSEADMLHFDYQPDRSLEPTAENLWKEMLRFKSSIKELEETRFCIYIPPTRPDSHPLTDWLSDQIDRKIPGKIRIATLDYAEKRKIKLKASEKVCIIEPRLNMTEAINNDMNSGILASDAVSVENRYTLQVKKVMECTVKKDASQLGKEIEKLFSLSTQIDTVSVGISSLFIAAQAYYMIGKKEECKHYSDKAVEEAGKAMASGEPDGYPVWKSAVMQKAALLAGDKKRQEAIELYEQLAEEATARYDIFYIMEAYRLAGYFYYELGKSNTALESLLLSLYGGSFLEKETRRQSTFLISAALALYLARDIRPSEEVDILESSLEEWLGSDWKELVETEEMKKAKKRRKASLFS